MNYPVWNVPVLGGGLVVAIIAIIHVLISHIAIGGGAFLAVAEMWSDRQKEGDRIRQWLHRYTTIFLVYTTVFGAITGVGIWFSIQLASPEGTSLLIHQFVFAWAIEWVFFFGELSVLYLYYYGWKTNSRKMQRFLALAYFVIAWGSLFVINGILTFMLTPGEWSLENQDIAAGFFNPGFMPSLLIRTLVMILLGGLLGFVVAARIKDENFKTRVVRFCAKFVIPAAALVPILTYWYWNTLPELTITIFEGGFIGVQGGKMEAMNRFFWLAGISGALVVIGALVLAIRPKAVHLSSAIALLLVAQFGVMGAEFFREMARKPYVINQVLYSNNLWADKVGDEDFLKQPYFESTEWEPKVEPMSIAHGEWIYRLQCASCHTLDGYRGLKSRTEAWQPVFGVRFLESLEQQGVMPPFQGSVEDRAALTAYFLSLHEQDIHPLEVLRLFEEDTQKNEAKAANANPEAEEDKL